LARLGWPADSNLALRRLERKLDAALEMLAVRAAWPEGDDPRFTLDEIRRALHADHYGEGRDDPDDPAAEFDHRRAEEQFKRLHDWLIYCRANPDAFRVPER
jgi:hypothetical protein